MEASAIGSHVARMRETRRFRVSEKTLQPVGFAATSFRFEKSERFPVEPCRSPGPCRHDSREAYKKTVREFGHFSLAGKGRELDPISISPGPCAYDHTPEPNTTSISLYRTERKLWKPSGTICETPGPASYAPQMMPRCERKHHSISKMLSKTIPRRATAHATAPPNFYNYSSGLDSRAPTPTMGPTRYLHQQNASRVKKWVTKLTSQRGNFPSRHATTASFTVYGNGVKNSC